MDSPQTATINSDVQVRLEQRREQWDAPIEPPENTVYGATEAETKERVNKALDFFVDSADAVDLQPSDRARFTELADQWEQETVLLSDSTQAVAHPAHRQIVSMGEPVVPLILERMRSQGGHWFQALGEITGAAPVAPGARGDVVAMQQAWLDWGGRNGIV